MIWCKWYAQRRENRRTWQFDSAFHINFLQAGGFQAKVPSVIRRSRARTGGCYKNLAPKYSLRVICETFFNGGVVEWIYNARPSLFAVRVRIPSSPLK